MEIIATYAGYQLSHYRNTISSWIPTGALMKLPGLEGKGYWLRMNILIISPNIPYPMAGFSSRNYYLLKALASKHSVSLFALNDGMTEIHRNISLLEDMTRELKMCLCKAQEAPLSERG